MNTLQDLIGEAHIERNILKYPELNAHTKTLYLQDEVWKDIVNFEGIYQISNIGRIKRLAQRIIKPFRNEEIILRVSNDTAGYPQVTLAYNKRRVARVHRLVAEHFLESPSEALKQACVAGGCPYVLINHKDGQPTNPHVSNLEWCSPLHNNLHGKNNLANPLITGSACYTSVLVEEDVTEIIRLLKQGKLSQEKIGAMFGVKQITISNIWCGRSWSHFTGIKWKARSRKHKPKSEAIAEQKLK